MELREYLSVRRAYNLVRQGHDVDRRLTFEELAILCRLEISGSGIKTSEIAEYQGALRPTMTHRTNHLASLGYIDRQEGQSDRRNIVCEISEDGRDALRRLCAETRSKIQTGQPLARTSPERIMKYVDAMGALYCTAGELVVLVLHAVEEQGCTVSDLVERLGLLQPTVSMSVNTLSKRGLVERTRNGGSSARSTCIVLTEEGNSLARRLLASIGSIVVRRRSRK